MGVHRNPTRTGGQSRTRRQLAARLNCNSWRSFPRVSRIAAIARVGRRSRSANLRGIQTSFGSPALRSQPIGLLIWGSRPCLRASPPLHRRNSEICGFVCADPPRRTVALPSVSGRQLVGMLPALHGPMRAPRWRRRQFLTARHPMRPRLPSPALYPARARAITGIPMRPIAAVARAVRWASGTIETSDAARS